MSTDHNFWRERRDKADSNQGPSAYQPNALPLGQMGSHKQHHKVLSTETRRALQVTKDWVGLAVRVTTRKNTPLACARLTHNMNANSQRFTYKLATVEGELNQRHKLACKTRKMCKHFPLLASFGCCVNIYPKHVLFSLLLRMRAPQELTLCQWRAEREKKRMNLVTF